MFMMLIDVECKFICSYMLMEIYDERHELAMTNESIDGNMHDECLMNT